MDEKHWYVVNTKARNEERAAVNLAQGGIDVLAPKLRFRRWREGKFTDIIEPMFPGYIFVKFHPVDEFRLVKYTRGIKTIVNFNGRIIPLQERLIDFIRERLTTAWPPWRNRPSGKGRSSSSRKVPSRVSAVSSNRSSTARKGSPSSWKASITARAWR
jgi:transcription antitermination factor NusG